MSDDAAENIVKLKLAHVRGFVFNFFDDSKADHFAIIKEGFQRK